MQDILIELYTYAQETQVPGLLRTGDHDRAAREVIAARDAFQAALTEAQSRQLEELRDKEHALTFQEDLALFRSGLSLGLTLGFLALPEA